MLRSYQDPERPESIAEFPRTGPPEQEQPAVSKFKIRVRFDYRGLPRPARFFFGGRGAKEVAEDLRQQQANMWRNIPIQGVQIEDIEFFALYTVYDEVEEADAAFAPAEIRATVDSLEDLLRFVSRAEFRRVEFIEPHQICLTNRDLERLFFKFGEGFQHWLKEQEIR